MTPMKLIELFLIWRVLHLVQHHRILLNCALPNFDTPLIRYIWTIPYKQVLVISHLVKMRSKQPFKSVFTMTLKCEKSLYHYCNLDCRPYSMYTNFLKFLIEVSLIFKLVSATFFLKLSLLLRISIMWICYFCFAYFNQPTIWYYFLDQLNGFIGNF